jgi:cytochrome c-type biogenesis protein CcmE
MTMSGQQSKYVRFGVAIAMVLISLGYLAWTGVEQSKSYYVTIRELQTLDGRYAKRLRVAGNVVSGSIRRQGSRVQFELQENDLVLPVTYQGTETPPDTFKDDSQALVEGQFGMDGVFHANQLQAKCASKYAPKTNDQPAPSTGTGPVTQKTDAGILPQRSGGEATGGPASR